MKRGLVVRDTAERDERVRALQALLRRDGLAAALVYGDVSRSDDIAYLTNLCIYWNEGVLAVPAEGAPALITKLSKRVQPWMRATSTLTDIRSGPDVAGGIARFVGPTRLGIVDAGWWPAALLREVERALPEAELVPLDDAVRKLRVVPSPHELTVLREAGAALSAAVDTALAAPYPLAALERAARSAGFTDLIARAGTGWIDATGQYRTLWVRAARSKNGALAAQSRAAAARLRAGQVPGARCISHADLATGGDLRESEPVPRAGEVVTLLVEEGGAALADTYLVGEADAECLTGPGLTVEADPDA